MRVVCGLVLLLGVGAGAGCRVEPGASSRHSAPRAEPVVAQVLAEPARARPASTALASTQGEPRARARRLTQQQAGRYLLAAARVGDAAVVRGLLAAGATPDHADEHGYTALILSAYHGHAEVVDALLAAGANACQADRRGNTALMGAAFKGYEEIAARLSTAPCQVDQTNASGRTALMFAAMVGRTGILRLLESRGAQREQRDAEGRSAADWARTQGLDLPAHD